MDFNLYNDLDGQLSKLKDWAPDNIPFVIKLQKGSSQKIDFDI